MTTGLHAANLAHQWLSLLRNVPVTERANIYVKLHTGDPGANGTANASSVVTRPEVTFAAPANGSMAANNTPSWANWAGTNGEVVTHISIWDSATAGSLQFSVPLSASKTINTGDTLNLSSLTFALTPIAA